MGGTKEAFVQFRLPRFFRKGLPESEGPPPTLPEEVPESERHPRPYRRELRGRAGGARGQPLSRPGRPLGLPPLGFPPRTPGGAVGPDP